MWNFHPLSLFVFFFALACERICIKTRSIKIRCVTGPGNRLFKLQAHSCIFQPGHFTGWGSERVNLRDFESRCVIGPENILIKLSTAALVHPSAQENLQAGAVKGLTFGISRTSALAFRH